MKTRMTRRSLRRAQEDARQLLPGIPDEISLDFIVPKLPWTAFQTLSSVSPKWRHAIHSGQVYQARVRSRSTDTLVVVSFGQRGFAVHSTGNKSWLALPPTPNFNKTEGHNKYVFLDGKLYVFGNLPRHVRGISRVEVYVLDLACHERQWKHWGIRRELISGIAVDDDYNYCSAGGQLYVLRPAFAPGGYDPKSYTWSLTKDMSPVAGFTSEVYDPKLRSWSPRKPFPTVRRVRNVATLGDELLVYSGCRRNDVFAANSLEVYNPAKDEWRNVGHWNRKSMKALFTADEKIYAMTECDVWVHDSENTWEFMHTCSYRGIARVDDLVVLPDCVQAIDAELIAKAYLYDPVNGTQIGLIRSIGFKSEWRIVWEKVELPGPFRGWRILGDMMLPIQL